MRPGRRPLSPHVLPGVALVLIALSVLAQTVPSPAHERPWLSVPPGAVPPAATPLPLPQTPFFPTERVEQIENAAGAAHSYAERYTHGDLPALGGGAGNTYYIATTGSDSNPCTLALPCLDPQRFSFGQPAPVLVPGDTVVIEAGTYNLTHVGGPSTGAGLWQLFGVHGTPGNPITFMGQGTVIVQRSFPASDDTQKDRLMTFGDSGGNQIHDLTFTNLTFIGMLFRSDFVLGDNDITSPIAGGGADIEIPNGPTYGETWDVNNIIWDHITVMNTGGGCLKGGLGMTLQNSTLSNCGMWTTSHMYYDAYGGAKMDSNVFTGTGNITEGQAYYCAPGGNVLASASSTSSVWTFLPGTVFNNVRVGDFVQITKMVPTAYNGIWQVASVSSSQMTINQPGNPGPSSAPGYARNTNSGCQITNNLASNCWYSCLFVTAPNTLVRGNVLFNSNDCATLGDPDIRAIAPITFTRNVLANCGMTASGGQGSGLALYSPGGEVIINNTFFGRAGGLQGIGNGIENDAVIYRNNIYASSNPSVFPHAGFPGGAGSVEDTNLFYNVTFGAGSFVGAKGPHDITADPAFVSAPYETTITATTPLPNLQLTNGSPAVDMGTNVGQPFLGTAPDAGAYESSFTTGGGGGGGGTPVVPTGGGQQSPHVGHRR